MFVTVPQSQLAAALRVVGRAVAARSTLPVTGHVLLSTKPGKLKLAATNMDLAIVTVLDAAVQEEGAMTVPARTFTDLVGSLPDTPIELRRGRTPDLTIKAPRFAATAKGLDAAEFPAIDAPGAEVRYAVAAQAFRQAIDDVIFAAARDQTRPQLSGLLLRAQGDALTLVGCDGFRLSVRRLPLTQPVPDGTPDLIVPRSTMAEVARGFGALDGPVTVACTPTGGQVVFMAPTLQFVSRLIDGAYVDFDRVLRQTDAHDVTIAAATADVQHAAHFTQIVARDADNHVRIDALPGASGTLVFQATAAQVGDNSTEVAARIDGTTAKLALDNTYLADVLGAIRTERLVIRAKAGAVQPVLLRPEPDGDARHVIMPIVLSAK